MDELSLSKLEHEVREWSSRNFPENRPYQPLLGALEELGELSHAHLKGEQGIRHSAEEIVDMKMDAIGDVIIYLADYCWRNNISLSAAVYVTWMQVKLRDWKANEKTGEVR